jgi:hypothetical protein
MIPKGKIERGRIPLQILFVRRPRRRIDLHLEV